jgi:hypothetical protein
MIRTGHLPQRDDQRTDAQWRLNESYQFKRMIHGIHGNSKRLYPFTHGNKVVGAFCNPANPLSKAPICDPNLVLASWCGELRC